MNFEDISGKTATTIVTTTLSPKEKDRIIKLFTYIMRNSKEKTAISFLELISIFAKKSYIELHENIKTNENTIGG